MHRGHGLLWSVVALLFFFGTPALAQQDNGVGFGLEGGITRATIHSDGPSDFIEGRNGLMGGIWFGGNRNGRVGFMGELTYVVKGAEVDGQDLELHYLEIPALFRINIGSRSRGGVSVYPLFGPVVDIQLKSSLEDLNVKDQFNGVDFGVIGGIGIEITRIGFEVRGNWGMRSLLTDDEDFAQFQDSKNFAVQALVKVRIN